jgi:hypothetical protein
MPYSTDIWTYFTRATGITDLVYSTNPDDWIDVTLLLETAGPVAYGTRQDISPVTSGKGRLLVTGVEARIALPPASRLYIVADTINRVGIQVAPVPWQRQIHDLEAAILKAIAPSAAAQPRPGSAAPVPIGRFGFPATPSAPLAPMRPTKRPR